jgi:hypothetical protein
MAELASQPREIPGRTAPLQIPPPSSVSFLPPSSASKLRSSHLQLDTFSPVNQNGSFEFDRVLKSGYVQKRTRRTKVERDLATGRNASCTNEIHRHGSRFSSSCDLITSRYTRIRTRTSCVIRSTCQISPPSHFSKTQNKNATMSSAYSLPLGIIISKPHRERMPKNG